LLEKSHHFFYKGAFRKITSSLCYSRFIADLDVPKVYGKVNECFIKMLCKGETAVGGVTTFEKLKVLR